MNNLKEIKNERIGDRYFEIDHSSGLKIYVYPQKGRSSTYAVIGTKYGAINTKFKYKDSEEIITVPDGIAHYLEHKLFESEDGDAFSKYAKTGASANAYTSFDTTCYLFSCTENFEESLRILLDLIQSPYFTDENVQKERGIIGQEIKMYEDEPSWKVMFNLLGAMYKNHPVKVDIAGTIDSISHINPENLYECYNAFYNLNNMVLCVAGNVNPEQIIKIADQCLKPSEKRVPETIFPDEPYEIVEKRVEQHFEINMPSFQLGFKEKASIKSLTAKQICETDIILNTIASGSSKLYKKLLDENLINDTFGYEYFEGTGYAAIIFSGESKDPDKAAEIIKEYVKKLHETGISNEDFERAKKDIYGRNVSMLNSPENIANAMLSLYFANRELYNMVECLANTTLEDVNNRLKKQLDVSNCALSVVLPIKDKEGK